jgi:hypothetical protein
VATVWVLAADRENSIVGMPLVKAEAIIGFRQTFNTVEVLGIHPGEPVTVAANFGNSTRPLPDGFHVELLKLIAEQTRHGLPDDHVIIVADHTFGTRWSWKTYPLSEYEFPQR